jgi:hypothetical protein
MLVRRLKAIEVDDAIRTRIKLFFAREPRVAGIMRVLSH